MGFRNVAGGGPGCYDWERSPLAGELLLSPGGRGIEGRFGNNERYLRREAERRGLLQPVQAPDVSEGLHRLEMPDGSVRYFRVGQQRGEALALVEGERAGGVRVDGSGVAAPATDDTTPALDSPEWRLFLAMVERDLGAADLSQQPSTDQPAERADAVPELVAAPVASQRSRL